MSDQEEYERGVHDGQNADPLDQFCNSVSRPFNNPTYEKGFDYGLDHKPSDSNKSDSPSPETNSKSDKSSDKPQEHENSTSSGSSYSGDGGYSGGGDWSGSNASIKPTNAIKAIFLIVFWICAILACICAIEYIAKGINSNYVTLLERGAIIKRTAEKKIEIENFLSKKFAPLSMGMGNSVSIEVVSVNESEFFATINPWHFIKFYGDTLIRTSDGGKTWQTLLESEGLISDLSVNNKNGQRIIKVRCSSSNTFWAISKDDGKTWERFRE